MKKILLSTLTLLTSLSTNELPDTYKLGLGTYLTGSFDTSTQIGNNDGVSVDLDLQKIFNMDTELASLYKYLSKSKPKFRSLKRGL